MCQFNSNILQSYAAVTSPSEFSARGGYQQHIGKLQRSPFPPSRMQHVCSLAREFALRSSLRAGRACAATARHTRERATARTRERAPTQTRSPSSAVRGSLSVTVERFAYHIARRAVASAFDSLRIQNTHTYAHEHTSPIRQSVAYGGPQHTNTYAHPLRTNRTAHLISHYFSPHNRSPENALTKKACVPPRGRRSFRLISVRVIPGTIRRHPDQPVD